MIENAVVTQDREDSLIFRVWLDENEVAIGAFDLSLTCVEDARRSFTLAVESFNECCWAVLDEHPAIKWLDGQDKKGFSLRQWASQPDDPLFGDDAFLAGYEVQFTDKGVAALFKLSFTTIREAGEA